MIAKKEAYKEAIRYIVTGGMTTLVNFIIYYFVTRVLGSYWLSANVMAWFGAVLFAYLMNQRFVFRSSSTDVWKQAGQFFFLRLFTLLIETGLLFICIQWLEIPDMLAKVFVSIVTIVGNYGFCKCFIFAQKCSGGK